MKLLTQTQRNKIHKLASENTTVLEIAVKTRGNRDAIYAYMKRHKLPFKLGKKRLKANEVKDINPGTYFNWQWAAKMDFAFA